ncbi:MAG: protein kinase, partial [Polyangiaceae bacterium]
MSEHDPLGVCGETLAQKYEIRELVASGGFSLVYKGHHKLWKSPIAVKFFTFLAEAPAEDRAALQQAFVNEGALLSELSSQSACIVQPRDVGTFTTPDGDWIPYMVMEWLDGEPLDVILDRENDRGDPRRTPAEVFLMLEGVARALELAHQRGVAHRDVKPENLVVVGDPHEPDVV